MQPSSDRPAALAEHGASGSSGFLTRWRLLLRWLPLVLVAGGFSWAYYAYVLVFCRLLVLHDSVVKGAAFGIGFHLLLVFCLWCYAQTTVRAPPAVPSTYSLSEGEQVALACCRSERTRRGLLDMLAAERGVLTAGADGCARYCEACRLMKPDRCHHCSTCARYEPQRCVPKMDHHCPWFNNCVCFSNYKFFLLTLFYVVLLSIFTVATTGVQLAEWWDSVDHINPFRFHFGFLVFTGSALILVLGSFLGTHLPMVLRNETTLECMRRPAFADPHDSFDVGRYENFVQVFGPKVSLWALPLFTSLGDGVRFPTKLHPLQEARDSEPPFVATNYSVATYSTGSASMPPGAAVLEVVP
ncbi:hypothetical protein V5799_028417 [Amblyomma americanum]|uniref:Palmitoyltransferase n=1 Tax=Amblyomma americanum TaxID=6943 RepID=A0AAQ4DCX5_AMBAM